MKIILIAVFVFISGLSTIVAQEDGIAKYFSNHINDDKFTHAYISHRMISAVMKMSIEDMDPEMQQIVADLKGMRMLSTKDNNKKHFDEFIKLLDSKDYEIIMDTRKPAEAVKIYLRNEDQPDGEILMVFYSEEVCSMTSINGKFNLNKITKLSRQLNIRGADHLEKIKRK